MRALSDDSDTDDSDYDPTKDTTRDKDDSDNENDKKPQDEILKDISYLRKRKANDLWEELNASDRADTEAQIGKSRRFGFAKKTGDGTEKKNTRKKKANSAKVKSVLAGIFGNTQATTLIEKTETSSSSGGGGRGEKASSEEMKEAIRQSVKLVQKKQKVEETKKFAGQNVVIQRSVMSSETKSKPVATHSNAPASSLDKALAAIKGPESVSTVAKSGADWDNFKEKEGLEDELQVAQKEGFLTRKEFLERVDYRKFEQERDQRLREQAIRGAPG